MPYGIPQGNMYAMRGPLSDGNAIRNRGREQFSTGYASGNPYLPIFNTPAPTKPMRIGGPQTMSMPSQEAAPYFQQLAMPQNVFTDRTRAMGDMSAQPYVPRFAQQMRGRYAQ